MTLEQKMGNIIRMESLFSDIPIKIKAYTFSPYLNDESNSSPFSISSMPLSYRNISSKKSNLSFRAKVLKYYRPDFHDKNETFQKSSNKKLLLRLLTRYCSN